MRPGRQIALAVASIVVLAAVLISALDPDHPVSPLAGPVAGDASSRRANEFPRPIDPEPTGIDGQPFARLEIPSLQVDIVVVEGVSGRALRAGAGHYPDSSAPGKGNVAIAGHRTGFGEPFRHLNRLRRSDKAILTTDRGRFTYAVAAPFDGHSNPWVTNPLDWTPIAPTATPSLTLTTADPPHTSKNRLIVRFHLIKAEATA